MRRSAFLTSFAGACIVVAVLFVMTLGVPVPGRDIVPTLAAVLFASGFGLRLASTVAGSADDESGGHDRTGPVADAPRADRHRADGTEAPAGASVDGSVPAVWQAARRPDAAEVPMTLLGRCGNLALGIGGIGYLAGYLSSGLFGGMLGARSEVGSISLAAGCVLTLGVTCAVLAALQRRVVRRSVRSTLS